ncbi:MAG: VOC family protein [Actinomycetota bacterium]
MKIEGIVFAGSATPEAEETTSFFRTVFGMEPEPLEGYPAKVFNFPDGSSFGVVEIPSAEAATRTIGFRVADLDSAIAELTEAGIEVGPVGENQLGRYAHLTAPDGRLYELVEKPA